MKNKLDSLKRQRFDFKCEYRQGTHNRQNTVLTAGY